MASRKSLKLTGAVAAGLLALGLSTPAQASTVQFDWVFQTAGVTGGNYGVGNVILTLNTTPISGTVTGYDFGYNVVSAAGSITWKTAGGTAVGTTTVSSLIDAALVGNPGDNVIDFNHPIGTPGQFAYDDFGISLHTTTPGLDLGAYSTRTSYILIGMTSADGYTTGNGDDYTTVDLPYAGVFATEGINFQSLTEEVPAPLPLALLGVGLAGIGVFGRRSRRG